VINFVVNYGVSRPKDPKMITFVSAAQPDTVFTRPGGP
jgi:hypothetical protein